MGSAAGDSLSRWLTAGRGRWPDVELDAERLARHLKRLELPLDAEHPHASDLYLACACCEGIEAAIAAFDRELIPVVRAAARRIDSSGDFVDEVVQIASERLLVATPRAAPRLAEYSGQGPLRAWVRIVAMRIGMNLLRGRRRNVLVGDEAFFEIEPAHSTDPVRRHVRSRYTDACADALRAAFAALSVRERNLLRMHHLHGLTVDELAPTFGVHRASVARWIAKARERLFAETRSRLRAQLGLEDSEADHILRELRSRIDITVSRLLAE